MRWLFPDLSHPAEAAQVRQTMQAIERWWQAFQDQAAEIPKLARSSKKKALAQFMEQTLQAIHPSLMWEFGPAVRQAGHRLIITPESQRWLRPLVRTILQRAPQVAGWEFYTYKLAEDVEQSIQTVQGRAGVDISGAVVDASVAPGRKIDLYYSFPQLAAEDEETQLEAAFLTTETLLGEQVLDIWIGTIGLTDGGNGSGSRPLPLEQVQGAVSALIQGIVDQLPARGSQNVSGGENWTSIKLEPPEAAADYPGRSDLLVASTHNVELFQGIHSGFPFSSACHSKLGEIFCYVKLDAHETPRDELVSYRQRFEAALNTALVAIQAGCCIGGGSGLRYSYIDLALTDLVRGVPLVRDLLAQLQAPVRTWLLFNDDDLAAEWIGAYPHTPAPPSEADANESEGT
jgi:hypothetical protein